MLECGRSRSGRSYESAEVVQKRVVTFEEECSPVIEWYKAKGKCVKVDTDMSVRETYESLREHFVPPKKLKSCNVVFVLGAPGCGKGTQCERLAAQFGLTHISTGDVLRAEVKMGTSIGRKAEAIMQRCGMVPTVCFVKLTLAVHHDANFGQSFVKRRSQARIPYRYDCIAKLIVRRVP